VLENSLYGPEYSGEHRLWWAILLSYAEEIRAQKKRIYLEKNNLRIAKSYDARYPKKTRYTRPYKTPDHIIEETLSHARSDWAKFICNELGVDHDYFLNGLIKISKQTYEEISVSTFYH